LINTTCDFIFVVCSVHCFVHQIWGGLFFYKTFNNICFHDTHGLCRNMAKNSLCSTVTSVMAMSCCVWEILQ